MTVLAANVTAVMSEARRQILRIIFTSFAAGLAQILQLAILECLIVARAVALNPFSCCPMEKHCLFEQTIGGRLAAKAFRLRGIWTGSKTRTVAGLEIVAVVRCAFLFIALFLAAPAEAHRPYFTDTEELGDGFRLRLLHGDGIIAPDPVRAVVVDADGVVHAISPLSRGMQIFCAGASDAPECLVYDAANYRVLELDRAQWVSGRRIEPEDERLATEYPEDMGQSRGFSWRSVTVWEAASFPVRTVFRYPVRTAVIVTWFAVFAGIWTAPAWRIIRGDRRMGFSLAAVGNVLIRILISGLFALPIAYSLYFGIVYPIYTALIFLLGLALALFLTHPRWQEETT